MNPEYNDQTSNKSINDIELEAASNATFDHWTQSARNLVKNTTKLFEDLDDHTSIIMTDIFGPNIARAQSRILEEEAKREVNAGHLQAANHFRRRDLNYSRSTLGEDDPYTSRLSALLKSETERDAEARLEQRAAGHPHKEILSWAKL